VAVLVNGLSRKPTRPGTQLSSLHRTAEKPAATKEKREETERLGAAKQRAAKRRQNDGTCGVYGAEIDGRYDACDE
jgi:hypothetical protein